MSGFILQKATLSAGERPSFPELIRCSYNSILHVSVDHRISWDN